MKYKKRALKRFILILVVLVGLFSPPFESAKAAANLSITPITWNIIGLDSNNVSVGPNHFPIGARVCNTGDMVATNVKSVFEFPDGNDKYTGDLYINLRDGTYDSYTSDGIDLAPTECTDFYYEVEVTRDSGAYDNSREYYITATADGGLSVETERPRELYVEYLISQSRNSVSQVIVDGSPVAPGGTMTLMVGQTYTIELIGFTATNGYEQIESFINFPNTIFQILSVLTDYTADTSAYVNDPDDKLYGDGCLWENDPGSPNYLACLDVGKAGGDITVTYQVKILQVPTSPLNNPQGLSTLIYDFSGSSFHYNSDFSVSTRYANIVNASIDKAFSPKSINPNGTSTLSYTITNPGPDPISSVNFIDNFPPGIEIYDTTLNYTGCGSPSPGSLAGGETSLNFTSITVAGYNTCQIEVTVTGASDGTYLNTTEKLYIGTDDTGSSASDTLVISSKPPPPSTCPTPVTMATWSLENYTASTSTNNGDFEEVSVGPDVDPASTIAKYGAVTGSESGIANPTTYPTGWDEPATTGNNGNSWGIHSGWLASNPATPETATTPYFQFEVDAINYGGIGIITNYNLQKNWSNAGDWYVLYSTDGTTWSNQNSAVWNKADSWQIDGISAVTADTGNPTVYFRVFAAGAQYSGPSGTHAEMYLDNIRITGCPRPDPPELSKAFSPSSIPEGSTSTLTFSINNPNGTSALSGVGFTDNLPSGLVVGASGVTSDTCGTGTVTATPSTDLIEWSGGTLAAGTSCAIAVEIQGNTAGIYENISDSITSTETGPNTTSDGYGTDTITVVAPPIINKSFGATYVLTGDTTSLYFSITNPNLSTALTGVAFTDVLPAGLSIADSTSSVCGGVNNLTSTAATRTIALTGAGISVGGSCDFSFTVTGSTTGVKNNTTSNVTSTNGGTGNSATANLLVKNPTPVINILKQVGPTLTGPWTSFLSTPVGGSVNYRFYIENTGDVLLNPVSVTDPDPVVGPLLAGCTWYHDTYGPGPTYIYLGIAPITPPLQLPVAAPGVDPSAFCIVGPIAGGAVPGSHPNTATASSGAATPATSTATYGTTALTIDKTVTETFFTAAGDTLNYSFVVTNSGFAALKGPVAVVDNKASDENCPAVSTAVQTAPSGPGDGDNWLDPGEAITCTASYTVQAENVADGYVSNVASASADGVTSPTDTETVYLAALTIDKDTNTPTVGTDGIVSYSIVVENTEGVDLTNFQVTDTLPFAPGEFSVSSVTAPGYTVNGLYDGEAAGDINLLAGSDTLSVGVTATITINIQLISATTGTYDNTAEASTTETGPIDDDGLVADDPGTPGGGADPETDEDVTVVAAGTITIIKDAVPDDVQDFVYTGTGPSGYDFGGGFDLDDDADGTLPNSETFSNLTPGSYSLTEGVVDGWSLTDLVCVDPDGGSSVNVGTRTATIDVDAGETVTCTYTNTQLNPAYTIDKTVTDVGGDGAGGSVDAAGDLISYQVEVVNTGNQTITGVSLSDTLVAIVGVPTESATADGNLEVGETWTWTYTYTATQTDIDNNGGGDGDIDNTAEVTSNEVGPESDSEAVSITRIFDPPFGIKTYNDSGLPILSWTMVWINDSNIDLYAEVYDPIPAGTTYAGYVNCTARGSSTTVDCGYDIATGRIFWEGTMGPDLDATDEDSANNEIVITFNVTVPASLNSAVNIATIDADLNGNLVIDPGEVEVDVASAQAIWTRSSLPETGFEPGVITEIPVQSIDNQYQSFDDVWLEIPSLGVNTSIVGVQLKNGEWDVTWLSKQTGWLEGSAFPTYSGNSVLTGHVYLPSGLPGPFVDLGQLRWDDEIIIHSYGQQYVYQVRSNRIVLPDDSDTLKHEEYPWLTLVTCRGYNEITNSYNYRVRVRAVLIEVKSDRFH